MIDMASVYADRYRKTPNVLSSAVMGQSPDPKLDPYTALNALKLVNESNRMAMAGQAQQPTSSPSIVAQNVAPPMQRGLGAMVPGAMGGQGMPPQGMPPQQQAPMPQPTMQAASGGLAGMPTSEEEFYEGGIIAFKDRGLVPAYAGSSDGAVAYPSSSDDAVDGKGGGEGEERGVSLEDLMFTSKGDPETYGKLAAIYPGAIQSLGNFRETEIKPDVLRKIGTDEIAAYREAMGPNTAEESQLADIKERKGELSRNLEEGKGVALLKAAYAVTQGNNWVRAFAGAGSAFGDEYNRALQADKIEKRSIATAQYNLADSKRKESLGLFKEGRAAESRYVTAVKAADKARLDKAKAYADAIKGGMNATKPLRSAFSGAGAGPKPPKLAERLYDDNLANLKLTEQPKEGETPAQFNARISAQAGELTARQVKDYGPTKAGSEEAKLTEKTDTELDKQVDKKKIFDRAWQDAKTPEEQGAAEKAIRDRIIANRPPKGQSQGKPSDSGVNKNSTTAPDISTIKGAPAGSTIGKQTTKGWEVLDPLGKVIGHAQQ